MRLSTLTTLLLGLSVRSLAVPLNEPRALVPDADPWYKAPAGFEKTAPGTVLRERRIVSAFVGIIPDPVETFQILYRTTAVNGTPTATATTVFRPLFAKRDRFVSFHTAYDSADRDCSPSYTYQLGAIPRDLIASAEFLFIQGYLLSGYIVSSPDYEGPDAAYVVGQLQGRLALDAMRAVGNSKQVGMSTRPGVVGIGYSGGAVATAWAAALQPTYAPDLNVKGWISGGTPANLSQVVEYIDDTVTSGFIFAAISGLAKDTTYKAELQPLIDRIITPRGQKLLDNVSNLCILGTLLNFLDQSIFDTSIQSLGRGILSDPTIVRVLSDNLLGVNSTLAPQAPVLLYHGTLDEIIPYSGAVQLKSEWCGQGTTVKFTEYGAGGHLTTEVLGFLPGLKFTADAFAGKITPGCTSETVLDDKLNPIGIALDIEPLATALAEVILAFGKGDANVIKDINTLGRIITNL